MIQFQGALFTQDYLSDGIQETDFWNSIEDGALETFQKNLSSIFAKFPIGGTPNEATTENDLIFPILEELGWEHYLTQQTTSRKGRSDVPDMLLFEDEEHKTKANGEANQANKYRHGIAVVENKAWLVPLDRKGRKGSDYDLVDLSESAPSTQILRYLSSAEVQSDRKIKWGMLANGRYWRLYFQDAKSRSEDFLELDLPFILGVAGIGDDLLALPEEEKKHWLKVFYLLFQRNAFVPQDGDVNTFHEISLDIGKLWERKVAENLSGVVFRDTFPMIATNLFNNDPDQPETPDTDYLTAVKHASMILLYRLLFVLYAEDRNLLPANDDKYDDYGMRKSVRENIAERIDKSDTFSDTQKRYWDHLKGLFDAISKGDSSIGVPPYNGGLFSQDKTPLLHKSFIADDSLAQIVDALSRQEEVDGRKWINYRDLSVQQLGSIYENLLEYELVYEGDELKVRPNIFARKTSGSYYTPEDLVSLILDRTIGPMVQERREKFEGLSSGLRSKKNSKAERLEKLATLDPAEAILNLRICDPAMGSGHFLVSLVDYLADEILEAIAFSESIVDWADDDNLYTSPLAQRIETLRTSILERAEENGWTVKQEQLDDRQLVRRIILKRVVHGVDMNPMAVELAKVSLWLHTFTVGAPLSYLDHHLRCGNSLFGENIGDVMRELSERFSLLINPYVAQAKAAANGMQKVGELSDIDIGEVHSSATMFEQVLDSTKHVEAILTLRQGMRWLGLDDLTKNRLPPELVSIFDGALLPHVKKKQADFIHLVTSGLPLHDDGQNPDLIIPRRGERVTEKQNIQNAARLIARAKDIATEQNFFHWQTAFPDIWDNWDSATPTGGFDAIIGNPPWDRMKLQEVEWFAARRPEIAYMERASDRKKAIAKLKKDNDPLYADYEHATNMAAAATRVARESGQYPLLSGGDVNLYSLFVERAMNLLGEDGKLGFIIPSGIAADKTASEFFKSVSTTGRLGCLLDFENRKPHFPDVDRRFKFCAFVAAGEKQSPDRNRPYEETEAAFFLHDVSEIEESSYTLAPKDFQKVNPNTGTAPIFRSKKDAELTKAIYSRASVLVDRSGDNPISVWPVKYTRMFDMTNDSHLFKTEAELTTNGAYKIAPNRWKKGEEEFWPLYEGKMVQAFDHRAANIIINTANLNRPAQPEPATLEQHQNPDWVPNPQFFVSSDQINLHNDLTWVLGYKEIGAATNFRTFIASIFPYSAFGNKTPLLLPNFDTIQNLAEDEQDNEIEKIIREYKQFSPLLCSNLNSYAFDFITRQKMHGQTLNLFIVEQLPVLSSETYKKKIGHKTVEEIIRSEVLELTYTSHDMKPFAEDMNYDGDPFVWNEEKRRHSRARLDALFFLLYEINRDDADYILSTFPIVKRQDEAEHGRFLTRDLILGYMAAFEAGDTDSKISA